MNAYLAELLVWKFESIIECSATDTLAFGYGWLFFSMTLDSIAVKAAVNSERIAAVEVEEKRSKSGPF